MLKFAGSALEVYIVGMFERYGVQFLSEQSVPHYYYILGIPYESILFVAAILTLWMAILSFKASRRANELRTVPKLIAKYKQTDGKGTIHLNNLDHSKLAYNLEVMPLYLLNNQDAAIYKVLFEQDGENYTIGTKDIPLTEKVLRNGSVETQTSFANIVTHIDTKHRPLIIKFTDSQGIRYFTILHFEKGKERILRAPTKLTLRWRITLKWRTFRRIHKIEGKHRRAFKRDYPKE